MIYSPSEGSERSSSAINVGSGERNLSLLGGAALTVLAVSRRGGWSIPALAAGVVLLYRGFTGSDPFYKALGIDTAVKATDSGVVSVPHNQGIHITRAVSINRSIEDLYGFWRDPHNLTRVINYIETIEPRGEGRYHWTLKLPGNIGVGVEVESVNEVPNEVIAWRSIEGSPLQTAGSVRFKQAPIDRGVEVHLTVEFVPPGGPIGQAVMKLFGEAPQQVVGQMLREFKQVMETGETPTNDGQPSGREKETGR